jgi:hypothetical protein
MGRNTPIKDFMKQFEKFQGGTEVADVCTLRTIPIMKYLTKRIEDNDK